MGVGNLSGLFQGFSKMYFALIESPTQHTHTHTHEFRVIRVEPEGRCNIRAC